jgi:hypothetical protein
MAKATASASTKPIMAAKERQVQERITEFGRSSRAARQTGCQDG